LIFYHRSSVNQINHSSDNQTGTQIKMSFNTIINTDNEPFNCSHCNTLLKLVTDEGGYCGASDKFLEIQEKN